MLEASGQDHPLTSHDGIAAQHLLLPRVKVELASRGQGMRAGICISASSLRVFRGH
jgi:hypothetical protein